MKPRLWIRFSERNRDSKVSPHHAFDAGLHHTNWKSEGLGTVPSPHVVLAQSSRSTYSDVGIALSSRHFLSDASVILGTYAPDAARVASGVNARGFQRATRRAESLMAGPKMELA